MLENHSIQQVAVSNSSRMFGQCSQLWMLIFSAGGVIKRVAACFGEFFCFKCSIFSIYIVFKLSKRDIIYCSQQFLSNFKSQE